MTVLGILGGSGVYDMAGLKNAAWRQIASPFGETSDEFLFGVLDGLDVVFVPRHGVAHGSVPGTLGSGNLTRKTPSALPLRWVLQ